MCCILWRILVNEGDPVTCRSWTKTRKLFRCRTSCLPLHHNECCLYFSTHFTGLNDAHYLKIGAGHPPTNPISHPLATHFIRQMICIKFSCLLCEIKWNSSRDIPWNRPKVDTPFIFKIIYCICISFDKSSWNGHVLIHLFSLDIETEVAELKGNLLRSKL